MRQAATAPTPYFPVSLGKLFVMSLCTIGMYQFYWFYQNWQHVRIATGRSISPFWRTFFFFAYGYGLFKLVRDAEPRGARLPAGFLAMVWIALAIFLTPLMVFASLPVQSAINAANSSAVPGHEPNAGFSGWNWLAVLALGSIFVLVVYGVAAGYVVITP